MEAAPGEIYNVPISHGEGRDGGGLPAPGDGLHVPGSSGPSGIHVLQNALVEGQQLVNGDGVARKGNHRLCNRVGFRSGTEWEDGLWYAPLYGAIVAELTEDVDLPWAQRVGETEAGPDAVVLAVSAGKHGDHYPGPRDAVRHDGGGLPPPGDGLHGNGRTGSGTPHSMEPSLQN